MSDTTFRSGSPVMIDYTPSSGNVAAGDVIVLKTAAANNTSVGLTVGIAHVDIVNATLGALAAGGGVYDVVNLNNAADYAAVWWDGTSKVTTTSTNNALFGFIVSNGGGGANSTAQALHVPYNIYGT